MFHSDQKSISALAVEMLFCLICYDFVLCGICGHRLRRHVRTTGGEKHVAAWGCTNRIANGRSACDSHHINEDVLEATIRKAFEDADTDAIDAVIEVSADVLGNGNAQEMDAVL